MQSNSKSIRYELSQSMKHLRTVPSLRFVSADVGAAMDIMSLLDRSSPSVATLLRINACQSSVFCH